MQAIILAAGMGKRLGQLTHQDTKCMIEVNGKKLIDHALDVLTQFPFNRIIIVVGFGRTRLMNYLGDSFNNIPIQYVENELYETRNNIYSLFLAKDYFCEEDTLLLASDLIFEKKIIEQIFYSNSPVIEVVDKYETWMDGTVIRLDKENSILALVPKEKIEGAMLPNYFKPLGIAKFSRDFIREKYLPALEKYVKDSGWSGFYDYVLETLLPSELSNLKAICLKGEKWYEIDDVQDLNNAEVIFSSSDVRLNHFKNQYGGYWRYSSVKNFCYITNPYFPPKLMQDEMAHFFKELLIEYPSGQEIQQLLAAKMFACRKNQILVGNGASELIAALFSEWTGRIGVIQPSFDEYATRMKKTTIISFFPENINFSYDINDLKLFSEKIDSLVLINPDIPSGNFISKAQVLDLATFLQNQNKTLILDESFVDFSKEGVSASLIDSTVLDAFPNLIVIRSISKTYGVPGLRLGVVASSNSSYLERIKEHLPIWNINSFAEFSLQIVGQYETEYKTACEKVKTERARFFKALNLVPFLRPIPSQANYLLCEVLPPWTATKLTEEMLDKHDIFLKDCTGKIGFQDKEYVRVAVRNSNDNSFFIHALSKMEK